MSTFDSDDLETTGYFLPEDSQLRLKKLREYVEFLATSGATAQGRTRSRNGPRRFAWAKWRSAWNCWRSRSGRCWTNSPGRQRAANGRRCGSDGEPAAVQGSRERSRSWRAACRTKRSGRYLFGVTLDQIDELNLLIDMISGPWRCGDRQR